MLLLPEGDTEEDVPEEIEIKENEDMNDLQKIE